MACALTWTTQLVAHTASMNAIQPAIRQSNGDLLVPAPTARLLEAALDRFLRDFQGEQGLEVREEGPLETSQQTANRQEFVDKLSASAGVTSVTVSAAPMPETARIVNHADVIGLLRQLSYLLFARP